MMNSRRLLIVNGDDFGQSAGINRGIIAAHEGGILTSSSLMVRWPYAAEAAEYARNHPALSVGLHLDFGEWSVRCGEWFRRYSVVGESDPATVEREIAAQLAGFRNRMRRGPTPLHFHPPSRPHQP